MITDSGLQVIKGGSSVTNAWESRTCKAGITQWELEFGRDSVLLPETESPGVCRENTPTSLFTFSFLGGIYHWPKPGRSQALKNAALRGTEQGKEGRHWAGLGRAAEGE